MRTGLAIVLTTAIVVGLVYVWMMPAAAVYDEGDTIDNYYTPVSIMDNTELNVDLPATSYETPPDTYPDIYSYTYPSLDPKLSVSVGAIVQFGDYEWRVLDMQDDRVLIITEYVISQQPFHHTEEPITWETSDIRRYLNSDFFDRFSQQDQSRIATTAVINNNNPLFGTHGGNDTYDRIFLLCIEEVVRYFGDSERLARLQLTDEEQHGFRPALWLYNVAETNDD